MNKLVVITGPTASGKSGLGIELALKYGAEIVSADSRQVFKGLGYGDNVKAALITRGLAEIKRLGIRMGCKEQTFYGLAGMGDLIVTALSVHSRNYTAGTLLGKGYSLDNALKEVGMVVEGINALKPAMKLAEKYDTELPIIGAVHEFIENGGSPSEAVEKLMGRERRSELHD